MEFINEKLRKENEMEKTNSARKTAAQNGQLKYFTGTPCGRGHNTYRYTKTGTCAACVRGYGQKYVNLLPASNLKKVEMFVHPNDCAAIHGFAEALAQARKLSI